MASMNRTQRAEHYYNRLMSVSNKRLELERIFNDLDSLVYASSQKPLDEAEKLRIIEELERLISQTPDVMYEQLKSSTSASDNSDILDVISAMKRNRGK